MGCDHIDYAVPEDGVEVASTNRLVPLASSVAVGRSGLAHSADGAPLPLDQNERA